MFDASDIYALPDSAKIAFVKAMLTLAGIDGNVDTSESEFIQRIVDNAGLSEDQMKVARRVFLERPNLQTILEDINDEGSARLLVQQLILLAHVDGEYHANEKTSIHAIARHFEFEKEWVNELEAWAAHGLRWLERGRSLVARRK